jgi:hypothetical protein
LTRRALSTRPYLECFVLDAFPPPYVDVVKVRGLEQDPPVMKKKSYTVETLCAYNAYVTGSPEEKFPFEVGRGAGRQYQNPS